MSARRISRVIYILVGILCCSLARKNNEEARYFNKNAANYETVLTPADFELGMELDGALEDDSDTAAMYNKDRFEGDIAMDLNVTTVKLFINGAISGTDRMLNAVKNRHQLWPNGRIPYTISSQYSAYSRSMIAAAMQEYSKHTCIQWVPKADTDVNYVYIMPDRGCYSMVGKTGGRQTLSLGSGCIQKGIIIHELMHAVGFFHEQSRTDRDDFITIMWNNIQPGMQGQFEKYGHGTIQSLGVDYDYGSIMHYGSRAFSRNGQPTIVPKKTAAVIGQRSGFSQQDSLKINKLYECSPVASTPLPTNAPIAKTLSPKTAKPYPSPPTFVTYKPEVITLSPITLSPVTSSTPKITRTTAKSTAVPSGLCKDTRRDCPQLAQQGWCKRNPSWMKQYCPESCGFCESKPAAFCEDLRVDCTKLTQSRYCITSKMFMKTYCPRSCGFCFVPPATEIPDTTSITTAVTEKITSATTAPITAITTTAKPPYITIWPILKPWVTPEVKVTQPTTETTVAVTIPLQSCRDIKHFCVHWKNAGFCDGIFRTYMKRNCARSCNLC